MNFLNPYNYIDTPTDRTTLPEAFKDGPPPGHHRLREGLVSGVVDITIETKTPLVLVDQNRRELAEIPQDAGRATPASPTISPVRLTPGGRVELDGSAIKGMLRSAYETITGSRFGAYESRPTPLTARIPAMRDPHASAISMGIVEQDGAGTWIRPGNRLRPGNRHPQPSPVVRVPRELICTAFDLDGPDAATAVRGESVLDADGQQVVATLQLYSKRSIVIWIATALRVAGRDHSPEFDSFGWTPVPEVGAAEVEGVLHVTGAAFGNPAADHRHFEQLVITKALTCPVGVNATEPDRFRVTEELENGWSAVIGDYARSFTSQNLGEHGSGSYAWMPEHWHLTQGRTLFIETQGAKPQRLLPAMISRMNFRMSPDALMTSVAPATTFAEMSSADRVFGWVQGDGEEGAYRGHVRIDPAVTPGVPVYERPGGIRLATLASPKPNASRFRVPGPDASGGRKDDIGFTAENRLRRWVALTHRGGRNWYDSYNHQSVHLAPPNKTHRTSDTWVTGWVKPQTTFTTTVRFSNLRNEEAGALLWLLRLDADHHLKLGLGKTLGFGAVTITISRAEITDLESTRARYRTIGQGLGSKNVVGTLDPQVDALIAQYLRSVDENDDLGTIRRQFLAAARGFDDHVVHYPRHDPRDRAADIFAWFASNERPRGRGPAPRLSNPLLTDSSAPPLLPYDPRDG